MFVHARRRLREAAAIHRAYRQEAALVRAYRRSVRRIARDCGGLLPALWALCRVALTH
jgi:hypothetical protein